MDEQAYDYDWIVIGSGFGGSVSALRLAEKGYSVCVLESGSRFGDDDFAEKTSQRRRYFFAPKLGMRGILRLTLFKDIFIASGSGVGGGSLGFANTLYRAMPAFFADEQWGSIGNLERELQPHYDTAERMLGVTDYDRVGPADDLLRELGDELGVADTFKPTRVGVYLGEPGEVGPGQSGGDPYFGGEGPERFACQRCGSCMVGCRHGAKNTLVKNYLWFAEKLGVEIRPEREVTDIKPIGAEDGSGGYELTSVRSGSWFARRRDRLTARGVVIAAGALGTNQLLADCKHSGSLARISERLGYVVRTNTESIQAVTSPDDSRDFAKSIAITSSIYPDPDTHIEVVTYGENADSMFSLYTLMTGDGTRLTRPLMWIGQVIRHPVNFGKTLWPRHWSRRTVILLVMQTLNTAMRLKPKRKIFGRGVRLQTEQDPERPNPTFIPVAEKVAAGGPRGPGAAQHRAPLEAIFNIPTTAHILGGAVIGQDAEHGVVDAENRVYGYQNLLICDGSAVPANPGVQPEPHDHRARRERDGRDPRQAGRDEGTPPRAGAPGDRRADLALALLRTDARAALGAVSGGVGELDLEPNAAPRLLLERRVEGDDQHPRQRVRVGAVADPERPARPHCLYRGVDRLARRDPDLDPAAPRGALGRGQHLDPGAGTNVVDGQPGTGARDRQGRGHLRVGRIGEPVGARAEEGRTADQARLAGRDGRHQQAAAADQAVVEERIVVLEDQDLPLVHRVVRLRELLEEDGAHRAGDGRSGGGRQRHGEQRGAERPSEDLLGFLHLAFQHRSPRGVAVIGMAPT